MENQHHFVMALHYVTKLLWFRLLQIWLALVGQNMASSQMFFHVKDTVGQADPDGHTVGSGLGIGSMYLDDSPGFHCKLWSRTSCY